MDTFWPKTPKFGDLGSKFLKTNVRFEITTFEIKFIPNFVKIRKLILFGPKYSNLKTNVRFEISTFEIGYSQNSLKDQKVDNFWPKIPKFRHFGSEFEK